MWTNDKMIASVLPCRLSGIPGEVAATVREMSDMASFRPGGVYVLDGERMFIIGRREDTGVVFMVPLPACPTLWQRFRSWWRR
jgi:hypothetical protein